MEIEPRDDPTPYDVIASSPNSALDSYYLLPHFQVGAVNRAESTYHTAGGKGNNLARAVRALGGRVLSLGIVGGYTGRFILDELAREKIPTDMVWIEQETRRSSTLISAGRMQNTVVLDTGNPTPVEVGLRLRQKIHAHALEAPYLVLTGSLPPGFPEQFYAEITRDAAEFPGLKVCLDCSGPPLLAAMEAGSAIVKVNSLEYMASLSYQSAFSLSEVLDTFECYHSRGLEILIVTDGPQGAYVFSNSQVPFQVKTTTGSWLSTAGAGDTFMAGLLLSLNRGVHLEQAAAYASAAAV
ncbi:MAG: hypothetical protein EHM21_12860, partial [Chloroflexi bacterium]